MACDMHVTAAADPVQTAYLEEDACPAAGVVCGAAGLNDSQQCKDDAQFLDLLNDGQVLHKLVTIVCNANAAAGMCQLSMRYLTYRIALTGDAVCVDVWLLEPLSTLRTSRSLSLPLQLAFIIVNDQCTS